MFEIEDFATHLFGREENNRILEKTKKTQLGEPVVEGAAGNEAHSFLKSLVEGTTPPELHPGVAENIRAFHKQNLEGKNNKSGVPLVGSILTGCCDVITTAAEGRVTITEFVVGDEGIGIVKAALYGITHENGFPIFDIVVFNPVTGYEYRIDSVAVLVFVYNALKKIHFVWEENGVTYHKHQTSVTAKINPRRLKLGKGARIFYNGDEFDSIYGSYPKCVKLG